jgi:hypothetical protein
MSSRRIITSRHVVFDENSFPFAHATITQSADSLDFLLELAAMQHVPAQPILHGAPSAQHAPARAPAPQSSPAHIPSPPPSPAPSPSRQHSRASFAISNATPTTTSV